MTAVTTIEGIGARNAGNRLGQRTPSAKVVATWIESADELEPVVTH